MAARDCDVAIVGAGLAGLVAGALLARRGLRVVLVDPAEGVGGGGGATRTQDGYWVDFGLREGRDVGDCIFPTPEHCLAAAEEADVALRLAPVRHGWRVHLLPEGPALERTAESFDRIAREILGCERPAALREVVERWAAVPLDESRALQEVALGDWLTENVPEPELRTALLRYVAMTWHRHPEQASVGRFMQATRLSPQLYTADDEEVGGMQGLMEPWARAIRERGGEIVLDCRPVEILLEAGRARGVLGVDRHNVLREVRAPVVIFTPPVWELFELVDAAGVGEELVATARALRGFRGDLIGWQAGLSRLPRLAASGEPDDHDGWNRFVAGPQREYRGGYLIPSLTSRRAAPPGRHLLTVMMNRWVQGGSRTPQGWAEGRRLLDENVDYLRRFYRDLDDCTQWTRHVYHAAPQAMTWWHAPAPRHGLESPGLEGVLLAGHTLEAPASIGNVDVAAFAGRAAARRAAELLGG